MQDEQRNQIDGLWAAYKSVRDQRVRDQLLVHYSPLVKYVAGRVADRKSVV